MTSLTIHWNRRGCGRCGGDGKYHCSMGGGALSARTCWGCDGLGFVMSSRTKRNRDEYRAWVAANKPTIDARIEALNSGRFGRAFRIETPEANQLAPRAEVAA